MSSIQDLERLCQQVRRDIVRMVHAVNSGHPGGSLGCTEFFVALYGEIMKHNPNPFSMDGKGEDVFFLSNGHISPVFYSVLARTGYFPVSELATFRKLNSRLQGHPTTHEHLPGVRVASGSLGQGLSVAIGAALAKKLNHDDRTVYTLHGDGELQEGQIWEAAMAASAHHVDNLIATVDVNGQQIDGGRAAHRQRQQPLRSAFHAEKSAGTYAKRQTGRYSYENRYGSRRRLHDGYA
jgi:transketolase